MDDQTVSSTVREDETTQPKWQAVDREARRILGVLVEKAKTTPDAYPLTLNALTNGCNQKSNRDPQMNLEADDLDEVLERLRLLGAVAEVAGSGRVNKYRHLLYDWLGVDKVELAVMAELLLRGAQTVGELRGRAARMEPIADLASLRPVLDSLKRKNLLIELTPPGRGQAVCHNLFMPEELEKVRRLRSDGGGTPSSPSPRSATLGDPSDRAPVGAPSDELDQLRVEVAALRTELSQMRKDLDALRTVIGD